MFFHGYHSQSRTPGGGGHGLPAPLDNNLFNILIILLISIFYNFLLYTFIIT